ncbi:serine--tRNA ligase [Candidatus Pacearchaeota archaeon]|nr:serine--tRNA ligase [Candidatus Pacearchaeota archaeon]
MLDIKLIRENPELVKTNTKNRGYDILLVEKIIELDKKWRGYKTEDDMLRGQRNKISESINQAKKKKDEETAQKAILESKKVGEKLTQNEIEENKLRAEMDDLLARIPNIQHQDNPVGDADKNKEVKKWGEIKKLKIAKGHLELMEALDIIDIKRATKISGAGFYILKGKGAKLQRALIQYMLDLHEKNGFVEINSPQLVLKKTAFGTGNLPKFEDQLYKTNDDLILVPTAEVPVTNIYADEIVNEKDLPYKFCAFTECYRTEAGRKTGEEGLFRLHQFEKVEMVYLSKPEDSYKMLEEMTGYAEKILENLELPYRRLLLATMDAGFSSAKTYDIEIWAPGIGRYLETSSCSNCTDFQARRMNCRYQGKDGLNIIHTLNGSGLALPRLMIALIETNQQEDGSIKIPKVLWPYTGFKEIKKESPKEEKVEKKEIKKKK